MARLFFSILLTGLALSACKKEDPPLNPAPPIMGFGDLQATLEITGSLEVTLYLSKAAPASLKVPVTLGGDALPDEDFSFEGDAAFFLEPGVLEAKLLIRALPSADEKRLDRKITLTLEPADGIRLDESRRTMTIVFSLKHTVNLGLWAKDEAFPKFYGYTSFGPDPVPDGPGLHAGEHFCFAYKSKTEANVIGLYNPAEGKSTNAFNMHRIYADDNVSSGSANIRIPRALRFTPAYEGATFGTVEIPTQQVLITRTASSGLPPFLLGLSGNGTYSEETGVIVMDVYFDETALGRGANILRKYVFEKEERP